LELFDLLREFHKRAPFLFFNGNTFSDIGRRVSDALFADVPTLRRRELTSSVAHYIAGVLDRDSMIAGVESLCRSASLTADDAVQTLKGTLHGVIVRILPDGKVVWQPCSGPELTCLPESLIKTGS